MEALRARLEADLRRLGTAARVPGAALALAVGGRVIEVPFGVTNTRTRVPVTGETLFQIQSITKLFTATLVMQLLDDGLVQLDEPIQAYLPEFHTADRSASAHITVRHLLTHTGGFEGDLWQPTSTGPDALERFVRELVSEAPQHSTPGARFSYCSAGFGVLGRLVEVLRDTTYEHALRLHLAEPLGIHELAFSADQALAYSTAIGHVHPDASTSPQPTRSWALLPPSNPAAGNQLALSARGLLALGRMFAAEGRAPGGAQVLTKESTALMLQPQLQQRASPAIPVQQALGWYLPRPGVAEHGGGAPGIAALLQVLPEQNVSIALLTNADAGGRLAPALLDGALRDLADLAPRPSITPPDDRARSADPTPVLGHYSNRQTRFEIATDIDGRFWMLREPQNEAIVMSRLAGAPAAKDLLEIRPLGHDTFAVIDEDGNAASTVSFLDQSDDGAFRLLATGRVAVREPRAQNGIAAK